MCSFPKCCRNQALLSVYKYDKPENPLFMFPPPPLFFFIFIITHHTRTN